MMKRCIISMGVWGIGLENLNVKNKKEKEKNRLLIFQFQNKINTFVLYI